jgi:hypothetical protein
MVRTRAVAGAVLASWLLASGCTTLREVPRSEYTQLPERKGARVETREGLVYEFDYIEAGTDSLTGYRHRNDVEGPVESTAVFRIAYDDIQSLSTRRFDWYRTGLVGGTVLAGVLVAGLGSSNNSSGGSNGGGGGKGGGLD